MRKAMPDFEGWALFAHVAECGSFSETALTFGLSSSTVSKAVSRLEAKLGVTLFHRTTRTVRLTPIGRALLARASGLLSDAETIEDAARDEASEPRGLVRISAPMGFGLTHIVPILPELMSVLPRIDIELDLNDSLIDMVDAGVDIGVRVGWPSDTRLKARKLGEFRLLVVAAPDYLARRSPILTPADLSEQRAVSYANTRPVGSWLLRHQNGEEVRAPVSNILVSNSAPALLSVVRAAQAITMLPEFLLSDDLMAGTLLTVLPEWMFRTAGLYIVTPASGPRPLRVAAVIDYLSKRLSQSGRREVA